MKSKGEKNAKIDKTIVINRLLSVACFCVSSCAVYTDYPDDGEYLSEYPYFFYRIDRSSGNTAEIDYNGKRIKANVDMTGSSFHINDKADVKKDEDGEPYLNAEDIIIRGTWSTDKEGNIILEINNGSRIVLNKETAAD